MATASTPDLSGNNPSGQSTGSNPYGLNATAYGTQVTISGPLGNPSPNTTPINPNLDPSIVGQLPPDVLAQAPQSITVTEIIAQFYQLDADQKKAFEKQLFDGGFWPTSAGKSIPNFGDPATDADAQSALVAAAVTVSHEGTELNTMIAKAAAGGGEQTTTLPGIIGHGALTNVDVTNPADVAYTAKSVFQAALGRDPTQSELDSITTKLQSDEWQNGLAKWQAQEAMAKQDYNARQADRNVQAALAGQPVAGASTGTGAGTSGMQPQAGGPPTGYAAMVQALQQAGFSGQALQHMVAIATRESGGNSQVVNDNPSTRDLSYGWFQINYFPGDNLMGPRTAQYGSPQQLLANPQLQANAAWNLSNGGKDFSAWTTNKGLSQSAWDLAAQLINSAPPGGNPQDAGLAGLGTGAGTVAGQAGGTVGPGPTGGFLYPFANKDVVNQSRRTDQGWDLQTTSGTDVLAAASGTITWEHDPNGFGANYPVLMLDQPINGVSAIYYGHVTPSVAEGTRVTAGQPIAKTNQGTNSPSGWLEIGIWGKSGPTGQGALMKSLLTNAPAGTDTSVGTGTGGVPGDNYIAGQAIKTIAAPSAQAAEFTAATTGANRLPYGANTMLNSIGQINQMIRAQR